MTISKAIRNTSLELLTEQFTYVDALRASGRVNMYASTPIIAAELGLTTEAATFLFRAWASSYMVGRPAHERAERAKRLRSGKHDRPKGYQRAKVFNASAIGEK